MKTKIFLITIFALCFSLGVISCDDDKNGREDKILSVKDFIKSKSGKAIFR
ncbi:hypothetical protein C7377_0482 [Balneicella halophila]|uniref:Lipoprotein n=1 Tax=Balneicella halophila TaxID=1537566 RepID=A0A7L4UR89_BALHA|nr:hypothetical protein [Balneicella halophila]PVX52179.1 hypothetical protein C7377_0482 [Balneicella halophila]